MDTLCQKEKDVERDSQVMSEFSRLDKEIQVLDNTVARIEDKIGKIRFLPPPAPEGRLGVNSVQENLCPLANMIRELRYHVENINNRAQCTEGEIEL